MPGVFCPTWEPWRTLVKAFQEDLAQRIDRNLDQNTTLSALDLRPKCQSGKQQASTEATGVPSGDCADDEGITKCGPQQQPRSDVRQGVCRSSQRRSPPAASPQPCIVVPNTSVAAASIASLDLDVILAPSACPCADLRSGSTDAVAPTTVAAAAAAATAFVARARARLHVRSGAGPSPDGVLSPVSPPSSCRSSESACTLSATAQVGATDVVTVRSLCRTERHCSVATPYNDLAVAISTTATTPSTTGSGSIIRGAGAATSLMGAVRRSISRSSSSNSHESLTHIHTSASSARANSTSVKHPTACVEAAAVHTAEPSDALAPVSSTATAATALEVLGVGDVGQRELLQPRRPATLRLRCIVRDPATGSMLATARGHIDDVDLPLCRPQGPAHGPAVGMAATSERNVGGSGGDVRCEQSGHLLLIEEQVLGRGAFGLVTLVTDAVTEHNYALKRMRRSAVCSEHVMQEQYALRLLRRENIPLQPSSPAEGTAAWPKAPQSPPCTSFCSRCGGMTAPRPPVSDTAKCGAAPQSLNGGCRSQHAGVKTQCSWQCRFCVSGAAATGMVVGASALGAGGAGCRAHCRNNVAAGPVMGPARAAWLSKQQARGWIAQPHNPHYRQQAVHMCRCRRRRGASFCLRQLGTFQDDQFLYLLMEHCPGGDLDRLVRCVSRKTLVPRSSWLAQVVAGPAVTWRGLSEAAARFYSAGILLALEELHSHFIVYRDLKPGNVLLDDKGYPRLADFGMAKALGGPAGRATTACGTLDYMAPEIVKLECEQLAREGRSKRLKNRVGSSVMNRAAAVTAARPAQGAAGACKGDTSSREVPAQGRRRRRECTQGSYSLGVDWWSYGAVLYVLLTGCKPFCPPEAEEAGEDPSRVLVRIINPWYEVPLPVYLSPAAKDLLRKLLVRQPRWRLGCGAGGAEDVRCHPFFAGFDWDSFEECRMPPPFPAQVVSMPHDQEAQSVAHFFGFHGTRATDPGKPKPSANPKPHPPINWLQDF